MPDPDTTTYHDTFSGATCLITGGAGFIGSHLARRLAALGAKVRVIDDLSSGNPDNLAGTNAHLTRASILDTAALRAATEGCDYVFHHAAMVSVPESVGDPDGCLQANIVGTQRVLEAAKDAGVRASPSPHPPPSTATSPASPARKPTPPIAARPTPPAKPPARPSPAPFSHCYALSTVSLRYFNIFGPRQDPTSPYAAVISAFADRLIRGVQPTVNGDGSQTRDFTPVDNVVHANLLAASHPGDHKGTVCNIGTGRSISLLDLLKTMGELLGTTVEPAFGPPRAGDVMHSRARHQQGENRDRLRAHQVL